MGTMWPAPSTATKVIPPPLLTCPATWEFTDQSTNWEFTNADYQRTRERGINKVVDKCASTKEWCQHAAVIPAHSIWSSWSTPLPRDSYRWSPPSHCTPLPSSCSPALLPWHSGSHVPNHQPAATVKWVVKDSLPKLFETRQLEWFTKTSESYITTS